MTSSVDRAEALKKILPSGMGMPELALRFILSNPDIDTVIPGMRQPRNVTANLATSDVGPLSTDLLTVLRGHRWDRQPAKWSQ